MTCSHCGNHNPEGSPFCGSCGKSLKTTVDCNSCGEENPAESLFCGFCGISFSQTFSCDSCGEKNPSGSLFCGSCGNTFDISEQKDSLSNYSLQKNLTTIFQYPPKYFWILVIISVLAGGLLIWGLSSGQTSSIYNSSHTYITPQSYITPQFLQRDTKTPTPNPTTKQQDVKKREIIASYHKKDGIQYLQKQQYPEAIQEFLKVLEVDPNNFDAHLLLGNSYREIDRDIYELKHLKIAVELEPNNFDANWDIGHAYLRMNDFENSLTHFKKAVELDPNHFGARSMIGHVYLDTGRFQEAINQFEKSLTIPSGNSEAIEDTKRALQRAREEVKKQEIIVSYHKKDGIQYLQKQQYPEAIQEFLKVLEVDPNNFDAHLLLGNSYREIDRDIYELKHLKIAVELEPNNFDANWDIGHAYLRMNDFENSLTHFKKAVELDPNHFGARSMIGHVYLDTGRFQEAINQFEKSLTIPSDNSEAIEDTKRALQRAREIENAEK